MLTFSDIFEFQDFDYYYNITTQPQKDKLKDSACTGWWLNIYIGLGLAVSVPFCTAGPPAYFGYLYLNFLRPKDAYLVGRWASGVVDSLDVLTAPCTLHPAQHFVQDAGLIIGQGGYQYSGHPFFFFF